MSLNVILPLPLLISVSILTYADATLPHLSSALVKVLVLLPLLCLGLRFIFVSSLFLVNAWMLSSLCMCVLLWFYLSSLALALDLVSAQSLGSASNISN